jgi:hypothetical protein
VPVCPFAKWLPISGSSGRHLGGPFKIVHHTTEGSTAEGAFGAFRTNRSDPHFTVDATTIYQHIDTDEGARALRNELGGVQTNRDSAVQIELVGFAHLRKNPKALTNVARLCRWIEETHGVARKWPAGPPKPSTNGKDPGSHNRTATTWDNESGHYGHCHVPENDHWDPGYTHEEVKFLMDATFDANGNLIGPKPPAVPAAAGRRLAAAAAQSTMPDHAKVRELHNAYVNQLALGAVQGLPPPPKRPAKAAKPAAGRGKMLNAAGEEAGGSSASVTVGSLVSFVDGLSAQERNDVLSSLQLAQRGASGAFDRFTNTRDWYRKYLEILENLGWTTEQFAFSAFDQADQDFQMDQAALAIIAAIATQNQLAILKASLDALAKLKDDADALKLFEYNSVLEGSGNFQLGAVQKTPQGAIAIALGAFYFKSTDHRRRVLFFKWGQRSLNFWTSAQRMVLNTEIYALRRAEVEARLSADSARYIAALKLG